MILKSVSYRRVRNLGNYETASFEGTVELDPGDDPHTSFEWLKNFIHYKLGLITEIEFSQLNEKGRFQNIEMK
jgi:hypothetical protein